MYWVREIPYSSVYESYLYVTTVIDFFMKNSWLAMNKYIEHCLVVNVLSLQMHYHEAEHGMGVNCTAQVVCGDEAFRLPDNEISHKPFDVKHRSGDLVVVPFQVIDV